MLRCLVACLLAFMVALPMSGVGMARMGVAIAAAHADCDCPPATANCPDGQPSNCGCDIGCVARLAAMQLSNVSATTPDVDLLIGSTAPIQPQHVAPDAPVGALFRPPRL